MDMVLDAANAFRDHSMLLSDTAHVRPKAFSNIRIQDPNTFLCAENAMNVQARESVCHGKKLYRRPETIQHKCFQFSYSKFRDFNHRIGAPTCTNHTVPYGTALWGGAVPGTSCQATIAPSLRDISQQVLTNRPRLRTRFRARLLLVS